MFRQLRQQDGWINPKVVAKFEENLKAAGKKLECISTKPIMVLPSKHPIYDSAATKDAYEHTISLLNRG